MCSLGAPLGSEVSVHKGTMTLGGNYPLKYKQLHRGSAGEGGHL